VSPSMSDRLLASLRARLARPERVFVTPGGGELADARSMGDAAVLAAHLAALPGAEPLAFYQALARRQLTLAIEAGRLDATTAEPIEAQFRGAP